MRYEQTTTMQSLTREQQQLKQQQNYDIHAPPPPRDDELSFMGEDVDDKYENILPIPTEFPLKTKLLAELVGTYILVLIGCGGACVSRYGKIGNENLPSFGLNHNNTAVMWTIGAMLGIYSAAGISGGHLNPAITLAFCLVRPRAFSPFKGVPYIMAQIFGATLAAGTLLVLFHPAILDLENRHFESIPSKCLTTTVDSGVKMFVFGVKSHIQTCQQYDELQLRSVSPFARFWSQLPDDYNVSNAIHATGIEAFGTGFVVFIIFNVTSSLYPVPSAAVPPVVAASLGSMMYLLGPLTGDHLNPANEIGRRLAGMLWLAWEHRRLTFRELQPILRVIWYDVTPYIVGPLIGGPVGALLADAMQPVY
jgi:glycerol uptake facilitator-like aquaporin